VSSPDSTRKAKAYAQRFEGRCDYVYRYERDETAKLLREYSEFLDSAKRLVSELGDVKADKLSLEAKLQEFQKAISTMEKAQEESKSEILRQKKIQKLYAKFGKRNVQSFIQFIEREYGNHGFNVKINDDEFESQYLNYFQALPDYDEKFLLEDFAKITVSETVKMIKLDFKK
jgi:hypothetical protein